MEKKKETASTASPASTSIRMELYMMLNQLKGARYCASLYRETYTTTDDDIPKTLNEAVEKINAAMCDVATVIGWDVLAQIEDEDTPLLSSQTN